jgi:nucleoid-associated protein YgaU
VPQPRSFLAPALALTILAGLAAAPSAVAAVSVTVQPGDTLWSIATSLDGDGDVRAVVDEIQELNGLNGAALVPGQTLLLP